MEPLELVACALVGVAAGVLSAMFGVGGAVVTTPAIRALGVPPLLAVGSTIPAILPAALSGAHRYARAGLVQRRVALTCGLAGAATAVAGAWVSDQVDARWLMVATAGLLGWSGVGAIRHARGYVEPGDPDDRRDRLDRHEGADPPTIEVAASTPLLALVGSGAGFVAGLLGVGGGIVLMPLFTSVLRLPVKVAVASSLVAVATFSVPALMTHVALDHVDWPVALALTAGSVPGARLGAHLALRAADATMQLALGVFFCAAAVVFGGSELASIVR